jgi:hypothetical protein
MGPCGHNPCKLAIALTYPAISFGSGEAAAEGGIASIQDCLHPCARVVRFFDPAAFGSGAPMCAYEGEGAYLSASC